MDTSGGCLRLRREGWDSLSSGFLALRRVTALEPRDPELPVIRVIQTMSKGNGSRPKNCHEMTNGCHGVVGAVARRGTRVSTTSGIAISFRHGGSPINVRFRAGPHLSEA